MMTMKSERIGWRPCGENASFDENGVHMAEIFAIYSEGVDKPVMYYDVKC